MYANILENDYGNELWKSDGTANGTVLVKDINPGVGSSLNTSANSITHVNGILYFEATDGSNGFELWKSDGTAAGTVMVKDINPGSSGADIPTLTNVNGVLYFVANNGTNGKELWKSDGTAAGTVLVKDIYPGLLGSSPNYLTNVNGVLYFSANNGTNGEELWKSDGTAAGTVMVKDIYPGLSGSFPMNLTNVNGVLYFSASNGTNGNELWKSDGTAAGTVLVKDINPGSGSATPLRLTNVNGILYFAPSGNELWKSDGTAAGTVMVKDIYPGSGSSNPRNLTNLNGVLYFSANDGTNGQELWKSDGTAAGTVMVKDIYPGTGNSIPSSLTIVNGVLYFTANDGTNGAELRKSDGTAAGTVMVKDLYEGEFSSIAEYLVDVTDGVTHKLFFTTNPVVNNFQYGTELWSLGNCTMANNNLPTQTNAGITHLNQEQQTSPASAICHCDVFNNLISTVDAIGANPVAGSITSKVWIEATQPASFVKRHYEITPATNAASATGKVTLYFTQGEFDDFNAVSVLDLPTGAADVTGKANLRVRKIPGISSDGSGLPGTYTGTPEIIDPVDGDIVWNSTANRWEVSFDVTGFSGFFIESSNIILPLQWLALSGNVNTQKQAVLNFKVNETNVSKYEIEKSNDSKNFASIATMASKGDGENSYQFIDPTNLDGSKYYRIKQIDNDSRFSYSSIIKISNYEINSMSIYPNPVDNVVTIRHAKLGSKIMLTDVSGKVLFQVKVNQLSFTIDMSTYNAGVYFLKTEDGIVQKIVKQ